MKSAAATSRRRRRNKTTTTSMTTTTTTTTSSAATAGERSVKGKRIYKRQQQNEHSHLTTRRRRRRITAAGFGMIFLAHALALVQYVESFSVLPSATSKKLRQKGIHHFQIEAINKKQAQKKIDDSNGDNDTNNNVPGYGFFQGDGTGYVPSGLSKEEYTNLRRNEANVESKKNYGAWGPSWAQSNKAPDGDWMVMPNLWTNGFGVNTSNGSSSANGGSSRSPNNNNNNNKIRRTIYNTFRFMKANFGGFMLGYLFVDTLTSCYFLWKAHQLTIRGIIMKILNTVVWNYFHPEKQRNPILQIYTIKVAVATFLTPFMNWWFERCNRRLLWTKTKTLTITAVVDIAILVVWASILKSLPR
mmetsp:Transcript_5736/g.13965  ORF Transcript_5736/g.13965 Transcript_5736/m.13965 type:complete len:359 (-) Transcript_5736:1429-2505(-)